MKTCRKCGESKPLTDFYAGHSPCKACKIDMAHAWRVANPTEARKRKARARLIKCYRCVAGEGCIFTPPDCCPGALPSG